LVSIKLNTSSSFRSIAKIISTLDLCLNLGLGQPSYGTILVWTKKVGIISLRPPNKKVNDWILIIDESISIGHERILAIYGVRASKIDFSRALTYTDLTPLLVKASNTWTAEIIKNEIDGIILKYGNIRYVVADGGNAITKSIKLLSKEHVYDITHKIAWFLKNLYSSDDEFINYTKEMSKTRFRFMCSDISHVTPPKQRVDSRFMNLDILSSWGLKVLNCLKNSDTSSKIYQKLYWVKQYEGLIFELNNINRIIAKIKEILKTKGLSKAILKRISKIIRHEIIDNVRVILFFDKIVDFLKETLSKLPKERILLCTSDIIESSFGKYKSYISQNPMIGFTNLALCLSAFTNNLDPEKLKCELEKTTINELNQWSMDNIGDTNLSKRRRFMKLNGEQ